MTSRARRSSGFSLVEITLALGVAAVSLIAIFGLLATGSQINQTASEQLASTAILTAVASDLRATPSTTSTSIQFGISIPANPVGGEVASTLYFDSAGKLTTLDQGPRYRLVVTFLPNSGSRSATLVDLRLTWPGAADPTNPSTGAAEIFTALNRN